MRGAPRRGFPLRRKLLMFSLLLLPLPWLVYQYIEELKAFLIAGQENAQTLAAQAIATALHERADLFAVTGDTLNPFDESHAFYAYPLAAPIQVDGYSEDWDGLLERASRYGEAATLYQGSARPPSLEFDLVMGVHDDTLFGFVRIEDDHLVYRHPGYRRLDNSDQLRLSVSQGDDRIERYVMLAEAPGNLSVYAVRPDWKYPASGQPVYRIRGILQPREGGYDIEFRIPLDSFGEPRGLHLAVADVDDPTRREVSSVLGTLPARSPARLNHLVLRSPELEQILQGLQHSEARVWIIDRYRRVRAIKGGMEPTGAPGPAVRADTAVERALAGQSFLHRETDPQTNAQWIIASHPIVHGGDVLGAIVVEQTTGQILSLRQATLERLTLISAGLLGATLLGLTLFSMRLAHRIHRLAEQTRETIDARGRIRHQRIEAEARAGDEFGTLSRSINGILQRLGRYTGFLEKMPRMLRHEINNPLNVITTSLENLLHEHPELRGQRHIQSTERGIARMQDIVRGLTEAASLEESLQAESHQRFNLSALVRDYIGNTQAGNTGCTIQIRLADDLWVEGNDLRIEQLLDKLMDNARDFCTEGGTIEVELAAEAGHARLSIANPGPPIPEAMQANLFDLMISGRSSSPRQTHLGLGLYIVRLIAESHGGGVAATNWPDNRGVTLEVRLPLAA